MVGSPTLTARSEKSSEWQVLQGHRAKTPIVSAIVTSAGLIVMWTIIFILWIFKRGKKQRRVRKARRDPVKAAALAAKKAAALPTYIVPPDPAILLGQRKPGEHAFLASQGSIELEETHQTASEGRLLGDSSIAKDIYSGDGELEGHEMPPRSSLSVV